MIVAYSISLVLGIVGLLWVIFGGTLADNLQKPERDPSTRLGVSGRSTVGAITGFGMGGLSAEFAPLDFTTVQALLLALAAAVAGVVWVRFVARQVGS